MIKYIKNKNIAEKIGKILNKYSFMIKNSERYNFLKWGVDLGCVFDEQIEKTGEIYGIYVNNILMYIGETKNKQGFSKARTRQRKNAFKRNYQDQNHAADKRIGSLMETEKAFGNTVKVEPLVELFNSDMNDKEHDRYRKNLEQELIGLLNPIWNEEGRTK